MAARVEQFGRIVQLGPALSVRGGIAAVERVIVEHVGASIRVQHIATMEDGSLWRKVRVFARSIWTLLAALRTSERLVVHVHFASRGSTLRKVILAWIAARAGRPLILHAHGGYFDEFFERLPGVLQHLLKRTFARADCFVVLSSQWRNFYIRRCGLSSRRVVVLFNPATVPSSVPARSGRDLVQFVFLGRISRQKGAYDLLQAFAGLPPDLRARARLVFAGDGETQQLRSEAAALGDSVQVHAWLDHSQCKALLTQGDVFVLPSYREGVPMALLEAMAHGLPVITTAAGGIPDVVADQCEGLLVRAGDLDGIRRALQIMIEDEPLRLRLGRHARSRAETFDVSRYRTALIRIYQRLLAQA